MAKLNTDLLRDVGIPKKFWELGKDTYPGDPRCLKQAEHYVLNFNDAIAKGVGLRFSGPTKSYRTFLATYVMKCLLIRGASTRYFSLDNLYELYVGSDDEAAGQGFLSNFKADLIVLDNLTIAPNKATKNALLKVITFRADNGLPFIVCTSLTDEELCDEYGDRIGEHIANDLLEVECIANDEAIAQLRGRKEKFRLGM